VLLALLSLMLCALLWLNGLLNSLDRPSVGNALALRQLQLQFLAAPALPTTLRPLLSGEDPAKSLADELEQQLALDPGPGRPDQLLQLALLRRQQGDTTAARGLFDQLASQVPPQQRLLLTVLADSDTDGGVGGLDQGESRQLMASWEAAASPVSRQLICRNLVTDADACIDLRLQRNAVLRLFGVSWLPVLLVLAGTALLVRELWLLWRGRRVLSPILGPDLNLVDVTLLIAGGFVVLGELTVPLVLLPASQTLLAPLSGSPIRQQGVQVLLLYLGLMAPPLLILRAQLASTATLPPAGGWLQWCWRPLKSGLRQAMSQVLMVLPLVALAGLLVERLVGDPGGSNPLLELVLTAGDPLALFCFAVTAMVLAPLFEETLFRGVLLPVLARHWGPPIAVLMSALVFGLAHLSLGELVPLLVLGVGLGWLRLRTGRLAPCVLMHGLWNGFTFLNLVLLA
jgi:membrane protease YdiL (CAAX protease family)